MNKLTVIAALVLSASVSQAKVYCSLSTESVKGSGEYTKGLYVGELNETKILVIAKDKQSAKVLDFTAKPSPQDLKNMDGQRTAMFGFQSNQKAGEEKVFLGTGHLDIAAASKNLTPVEVSTYGAPTAQSPIFLLSNGLALVCTSN